MLPPVGYMSVSGFTEHGCLQHLGGQSFSATTTAMGYRTRLGGGDETRINYS